MPGTIRVHDSAVSRPPHSANLQRHLYDSRLCWQKTGQYVDAAASFLIRFQACFSAGLGLCAERGDGDYY